VEEQDVVNSASFTIYW